MSCFDQKLMICIAKKLFGLDIVYVGLFHANKVVVVVQVPIAF